LQLGLVSGEAVSVASRRRADLSCTREQFSVQ
jgi:hypothetical protein